MFIFKPFEIETDVVPILKLHGNQISGGGEVGIPIRTETGQTITNRWGGVVDISETNVKRGLSVGLGKAIEGEYYMRDLEIASLNKLSKNSLEADDEGNCQLEENKSIIAIFDNVSLDRLSWSMPLNTCYRWKGVNFSFQAWRNLNESPVVNITSLLTWHEQYCLKSDDDKCGPAILPWQPMSVAPPEVLHRLADYLWEAGLQSVSQDVRGVAKAATYPLDGVGSLGNLVVQAVNFPTRFGTQLERAVLMLAFWIFCPALYYILLSRRWKGEWHALGGYRNQLARRPRAEGEEAEEPMPPKPSHRIGMSDEDILHISAVPGFLQFDPSKPPGKFGILLFALDATIPVLDLRAYKDYYPLGRFARALSLLQQVVGWWVLTSAFAMLAAV